MPEGPAKTTEMQLIGRLCYGFIRGGSWGCVAGGIVGAFLGKWMYGQEPLLEGAYASIVVAMGLFGSLSGAISGGVCGAIGSGTASPRVGASCGIVCWIIVAVGSALGAIDRWQLIAFLYGLLVGIPGIIGGSIAALQARRHSALSRQQPVSRERG